jgi:hypothetical protein
VSNLFLPMLNADRQWHQHGAIMVAQVALSTAGIAQASLTLFDQTVAQPGGRASAAGLLDIVDQLRAEQVHKRALDQLATLDELAEAPADREQLRARLQQLKAIQAGITTRVSREVGKAVQEAVGAQAEQLRGAVTRLFHHCPTEVAEGLSGLEAALEGIEFPAGSRQPLARLQYLLQALETLQGQALPRQRRGQILNHLLMRCQSLYTEALREVIGQQVVEPVKQARNQLRGFLAEIGRRSAEYRGRLDGVRSLLHGRQTEAQQRASSGRSSATLALPGPDEAEVFLGMRQRFSCTDLGTLARRMGERFEAGLRAFARANLPALDSEQAPAAELLLALGPAQIADVWGQTVDGSLGQGHSLYDRIAQRGIREVAGDLWRRAEHTIDLGERNLDELNVNTTLAAALTLPQPLKADDVQVREVLRQAILDLHPMCIVEYLPEGEPAVVTLTRLELGWPVALDFSTHALLSIHAEAARHGHPMHLVGLSPDGNGFARPENLSLARFLEESQECGPGTAATEKGKGD